MIIYVENMLCAFGNICVILDFIIALEIAHKYLVKFCDYFVSFGVGFIQHINMIMRAKEL